VVESQIGTRAIRFFPCQFPASRGQPYLTASRGQPYLTESRGQPYLTDSVEK